jgi:hypothetical protein
MVTANIPRKFSAQRVNLSGVSSGWGPDSTANVGVSARIASTLPELPTFSQENEDRGKAHRKGKSKARKLSAPDRMNTMKKGEIGDPALDCSVSAPTTRATTPTLAGVLDVNPLEPIQVMDFSSSSTSAEEASVAKESSPRAADVWPAKMSSPAVEAPCQFGFPDEVFEAPTKIEVLKENIRGMFESTLVKIVVTSVVLLNVVFIVIDSLDGQNRGSSQPKCGYLCPPKSIMDPAEITFTFFFAFEFFLRLIAAERYFKSVQQPAETNETTPPLADASRFTSITSVAAEELLNDIGSDCDVCFFADPFNYCDFVSFFPDMVVFALDINSQLDVFRVLKMFRLIKLIRNSLGIKLVFNTLRNSLQALLIPMIFLTTLIFIFSVAIFNLEDCANIETCPFINLRSTMYFTVVTVTTVGYGDQSPSLDNEASMWVTTALMLVGITYMAMPIAVIGNEFDRLWKSSPLHERPTYFSDGGGDHRLSVSNNNRLFQINQLGSQKSTFSHDCMYIYTYIFMYICMCICMYVYMVGTNIPGSARRPKCRFLNKAPRASFLYGRKEGRKKERKEGKKAINLPSLPSFNSLPSLDILEQYIEMADLLSEWQTCVLDILGKVTDDMPLDSPRAKKVSSPRFSRRNTKSIHAAFSARFSSARFKSMVKVAATESPRSMKSGRSHDQKSVKGQLYLLSKINRRVRTKHKMLRMDIEKVSLPIWLTPGFVST